MGQLTRMANLEAIAKAALESLKQGAHDGPCTNKGYTERQALMGEEAMALHKEGSAILRQAEKLLDQATAKFACARAIFDVLKTEVPGCTKTQDPPLVVEEQVP